MFNLNEKNKKESILDELYRCREEKICEITEDDKKRIKELIKNNDTYQKLLENIKFLIDDENVKEKLKDNLDSYIERLNIISSYENEKCYKIGFADAINLVCDCIKTYNS